MVRAAAGDTVVPRRRRGHADRDPRSCDRGPRLRRGSGARLRAESRAASPRRPGRATCGSTPGCAAAPRSPRSTTRCSPRSSCTRRRAPKQSTRCTTRCVAHDGARHRDQPATCSRRSSTRRAFARRHGDDVDPRAPPVTPRRTVDVLAPGTTTVQDLPGRVGLWHVGVPPSGPMDDRSFRLGNRIVGNPDGAPGLECTAAGPHAALRHRDATICLTGADDRRVTLDGAPVTGVRAGPVVRRGRPSRSVRRIGPGLRTYLLVARRLRRRRRCSARRRRSPSAGSAGTAGGSCAPATCSTSAPTRGARRRARRSGRPVRSCPTLTTEWELAVVDGPHAAPDFVTDAGIDRVLRHRLAGASPLVAHRRAAGGPAGRVGARPTAAKRGCTRRTCTTRPTPSARSTSPATCRSCSGPTARASAGSRARSRSISDDRWKLGQLAPGDRVRFVPVDRDEAQARTIADARGCDARRARRVRPAGARSPHRPCSRPAPRAATPRRSPTARRATPRCSWSTGR